MHVATTTSSPTSGDYRQGPGAGATGPTGQPAAPAQPAPAAPQAARHAAEFGNTELRFRVSEEGRIKVKIVNTTTGEIVREVPPESLSDVQRNMLPPGLLVDRAA